MSTILEKNINIEEWITQAEAARIRKVSRQAIHKLVKAGRIKTLNLGGVVFVNKIDLESYKSNNSGRPKKSR
jgi:predicted DNA-binding protein (UPF0251 family)